MTPILSKKQDISQKTIYASKKINIQLVIQNTHKLTVTSKQKKRPYFKTLFLIALYRFQNWL
jgi:uncharacterized membrane protein